MNGSPERGFAVREAAWRILVAVDSEDAFAGPLLEREESRFDDPRDRGLLHETVLGVLRHLPEIDAAFGRLSSRRPRKVDPPVRAAVRIGLHALLFLDRVPDHAAVHAAVEAARRGGVGRATGFVNAILRRATRERAHLRAPEPRDGDVAGLALRSGHPEWWTRRVVARVGWARAGALLAAHDRPAPTVLRVRGRAEVETIRASLDADGVATAPSPWLPRAVRVLAGSPVRSDAFRDGEVYVQDEASQLVPWLASGAARGLVIDCCAAPGGKAIQLAEDRAPDGLVVAIDRSAERLARVVQNACRMGATRVLPVVADVESHPPPVVQRSAAVVLVDAPCSGTGTLRRHPEIRHRLRPEQISVFARRQAALLARASTAVADGGRLIYSVCSMEPEEGPEIADAFEWADPGFRRVDARDLVPGPCKRLVAPDGSLRTTPLDDLDGFFAVAFERTGSA